MYVKEIVCFANSRKQSEHCIAGKEWLNNRIGPWIRPISNRPSHGVLSSEFTYPGGGQPKLLDIIKIPLDHPIPNNHQTENHVFSPNKLWRKTGQIPWEHIDNWLDHPETLWTLGENSSFYLNNRIPMAKDQIKNSLYLIQTDKIDIIIGPKNPNDPKSEFVVKGRFNFHHETYQLSVTDPVIEASALSHDNGIYPIPNPILCISLGEDYHGYCYKLIAAILYQKRFP